MLGSDAPALGSEPRRPPELTCLKATCHQRPCSQQRPGPAFPASADPAGPLVQLCAPPPVPLQGARLVPTPAGLGFRQAPLPAPTPRSSGVLSFPRPLSLWPLGGRPLRASPPPLIAGPGSQGSRHRPALSPTGSCVCSFAHLVSRGRVGRLVPQWAECRTPRPSCWVSRSQNPPSPAETPGPGLGEHTGLLVAPRPDAGLGPPWESRDLPSWGGRPRGGGSSVDEAADGEGPGARALEQGSPWEEPVLSPGPEAVIPALPQCGVLEAPGGTWPRPRSQEGVPAGWCPPGRPP